MKCDTCETDAGDESFCPKCWALLPKWARQEILFLRKWMKRGSERHAKEYGMACVMAARLISTASTAPAATG